MKMLSVLYYQQHVGYHKCKALVMPEVIIDCGYLTRVRNQQVNKVLPNVSSLN